MSGIRDHRFNVGQCHIDFALDKPTLGIFSLPVNERIPHQENERLD
jgi:hypothetical protein